MSREGVPTLLYTGVRLRSNKGAGPPPPADQDLGLLWIETQCAAAPEDPGGGAEPLCRCAKGPRLGCPASRSELVRLGGLHVQMGKALVERMVAAGGWRCVLSLAHARGAAPCLLHALAAAQLPHQHPSMPCVNVHRHASLLPTDDDLLVRWRKLPQPAVQLPPPGLRLTGWRDPFVYCGARSAEPEPAAAAAAAAVPRRQEQQAGGGGYRMLLGSGVQGRGGALLGYRSTGQSVRSISPGDNSGCDSAAGSSLATGWEYAGPVCSVADLAADDLADGPADVAGAASWAAHELGEVWECPQLARFPAGAADNTSGGAGSTGEARWLLAVSPYPAKPPHTPSNPVLYWIGSMSEDCNRCELPGRVPACMCPPLCCAR